MATSTRTTVATGAPTGPGDDATVVEGQRRALELAMHGAPLREVLEVLTRTVEAQSSSGVLASILLVDQTGRHLLHGAAPSLPEVYCAAIDGIAIGPAVGSCGTAAFRRETVIVTDVGSDPLWSAFKGLALEHGLRACWSTPIFASSGEVLGTFALYHRIVAAPSERDRGIVALMAHTAALVIEARRRTEERERDLRAEADAQVVRIGALFEHAPAGVAVLEGADHTFAMANMAYRRLVGGRDVLGQPVREALPEVVEQGFVTLLDRVRETGEAYEGRSQEVLLRRGGSEPEEAYFDFVYQPVPGGHGSVESILVVAFEVTDLVRARIAAEEARARAEVSEQALATFVDNLPELAWTARPDGHIEYYNRRWYEYTGTTFEEMQGWGWEKVHDPALLPQVTERWKHSLATGEPFEMEFTLRGADGVRRWFLTRVVPLRGADGKILRWFGTNTDIDAIRSSRALAEAMAEQSVETQHALLTMRGDLEAARRRVAELEAERSTRTGV